MINKEQFGKFLALKRRQAGFVQAEFAKRLNVSDKAISKWERGGAIPSLDMLEQIALLYKQTLPEFIDEFFGSDDIILTVALTGGPCSGKTMAINYLKQQFRQHGWYVFCLSETATNLIASGRDTSTYQSTFEFQKEIFKVQLAEENSILSVAKEIAFKQESNSDKTIKTVVIYDRGLCDGLAYLTSDEAARMLGIHNLTLEDIYNRYDLAIFLDSAFVINGKETPNNNAQRHENRDEALMLADKTKAIWSKHPAFFEVQTKASAQEKFRAIENIIYNKLNLRVMNDIPAQSRILVRRPEFDSFIERSSAQVTEDLIAFTQVSNNKRYQLRLRKYQEGRDYFLIEELNPSIRKAQSLSYYEALVTADEYNALSAFRDTHRAEVRRKVAYFNYQGQWLSLSFYDFLPYVAILEGEPLKGNEDLELPPYLVAIRDITQDETFTIDRFALALAQGKL